MSKKSRPFQEYLSERLKEPKFSAAYLNEHFTYRGAKRKELLLQAIKDVVQAQGYSKLARHSGVSRRTLYKAFSPHGNPTVDTLLSLLDAIGIKIHFDAGRGKQKNAA